MDGALYFASGARTLKTRNLEANPRCAVSASLPDLDVVIEGRARRVIDAVTLERIAAEFVQRGWPTEVNGDVLTASWGAPSAPPPWHLFAVTPSVAFGVGTSETSAPPDGPLADSFAAQRTPFTPMMAMALTMAQTPATA